jgi:hypothetical protein
MQLRFYARGDDLVRHPGVAPAFGQPARYIGREFVTGVAERDGSGKTRTKVPSSNPATKEGSAFDSESADGQAAARHCRKGALLPADKATAEFCGVPFIAVEFSDGVWIEKPAAALKAALKESA